ncbi:MAG: tRNA uridine-5-carboxymethylaminomethyl(34) synthesis GTPase MnmE [Deltaproteobacteria bacterium]|nr:tRNA uridine-5-carboxymethylaminomethyl(34) synthesis GTPase MnmE [Deltaproteobacteria bacterium]
MPELADTIAAVATPFGRGGIGVVKVSGPLAKSIARAIFIPQNPTCSFTSHHLYYGHIKEPSSNSWLDEVMLTVMRAPFSYTREDVVEIQCHSGPAVIEAILSMVLAHGARPAEPGEFTKRAFLNGRIDLTQAEAVMDLVNAQTDRAAASASHLLQGRLLNRIEDLREGLISLLMDLETAIDFPEEEIDIISYSEAAVRLRHKAIDPVSSLIEAYQHGRVYRQGIKTVILGRVNAGKSSLLNALLNESRAIVTAVPGTTRDFIEETMSIEGLPVVICDTAGIRSHADEPERLAQEKTLELLQLADLVLYVLDGSVKIHPDDLSLIELAGDKPMIIVANKCDLPPANHLDKLKEIFDSRQIAAISAVTGQGLDVLKRTIKSVVLGHHESASLPEMVPNRRQAGLLDLVRTSLLTAESALQDNLSPEFVAADIHVALGHLGAIIGETYPDEILNRIFDSFCIGK